jgi:hypothetical protein
VTTSSTHLPRHLLATLAYRFQKTLQDAPPGFPSLSPGRGVRTPQQLVRHMNGVLSNGLALVQPSGGNYRGTSDLTWEGEVARFHDLLGVLDAELEKGRAEPEILARLLQGPLADAMTHIGQLALLRRLVLQLQLSRSKLNHDFLQHHSA